MENTQKRRAELWFYFAVCAILGGVFCWLAIAREHPVLWWFGGPFILLMLFMAWKATRPKSVLEKEEEREAEFYRKHPILGAFLVLGTIAAVIWTIGGVVFRLIGPLIK